MPEDIRLLSADAGLLSADKSLESVAASPLWYGA
jgi:hypothetical protein